MAPDDWPDWLPSGWTMQISKIGLRTLKCYLDPEGKKFYSKPQVFKYLKTIGSTATEKTHNADGSTGDAPLKLDVPHQNEVPESTPRRRTTRRTTGSSSKKSTEIVGYSTGDGSSAEPNASPQKWLPDGWSLEVKTRESGNRTGMRYKCYTESATGRKFFSKPQVLNYLAGANSSGAGKRKGSRSITKPRKLKKLAVARSSKGKQKTESVRKSFGYYEVISRNPAEGLPPGWIKEVRMRKNTPQMKKDPYYLDPSSNYMFFSKLDALRYLDTGDIKKCAMKPLIRDVNENHHDGDSPTGEIMALPPESSKGNETPEVLPNGSAAELEPEESGRKYKEGVRSITGGSIIVGSISGVGSSSKRRASRKDKISEWLPEGWTVEVKTRDSGSSIGMKYKIYTELATGRKFFSKPQVLNHLASGNKTVARKSNLQTVTVAKSSSETETSWNPDAGARRISKKKKKKSNHKSPFTEVVSTSPADGLPPGWIKEIRTRKYSTHARSDPYYKDPLSGYIFRSKLDALRYIETGDIGTCAIKPSKADINGKEIPAGENDGETRANATSRQLVPEEENKEENQDNNIPTDGTTPKTIEQTPVPTSRTRKITPRRTKSSATLPGRSSKRLKGLEPEPKKDENGHAEGTVAAPENQVTGANVEKQTTDGMFNEIGTSWNDHFDFAVKTLTGDIEIAVEPLQQEIVAPETGVNVNENPLNVN